MTAAPFPILQFGSSRFLQAHADLFVSEALDRGDALGLIAMVQTTPNPASARRIAALREGDGYPVRIRGLQGGRVIDIETRGRAIGAALQADQDWARVRHIAVREAEVILSNTGDRGYELDERDGPGLCDDFDRVPRSFPAKLVALLFERWQSRPEVPLSLFPCELVQRNGDKLRAIASGLATAWSLPPAFVAYLEAGCLWANALVDRIVSEPIEPVGAVAEPYALWAIERQPGLCLPCRHEAIVLTDTLDRYERLKLQILNLGHTILAEHWLAEARAPGETVLEAMRDPASSGELEAVWREEVLPVFEADGLGREAEDYLDHVRERFANPFLAHRLADIAQNHAEKKRRRLQPVVDAAEARSLPLAQTRLRAALASGR